MGSQDFDGRCCRRRDGCGCGNRGGVASCKLICTDRNGNGICNCVFTVQSENGNCRTIDLRNCDNSCEFPLCEGCNVIENIATPPGIEPLQGRIFCDVSNDCCGRPTTVVSSDSNIDDQICVRRECGTTIIICKFDRVAGTGCDNGCACGGM